MTKAASKILVFPEPKARTIAQVEIQKECPLCQSANVFPLRTEQNDFPDTMDPSVTRFSGTWIQLMRCHDCDFGFTKEKPSDPDFFRCRYDLRFDPEQESHADFKDEALDEVFRLMAQHGITSGKLLDVGSFAGIFLRWALRSGFEGEGVELNPTMARHCREKLDLVIHEMNYAHADLPKESFDVITFIDVLEHLWEPRRILEKTYELLRPGGHLVIKVPNLMPQVWKQRVLNALKISDRGVFTNFGHVNHFSPHSLTEICEALGFEVEEIVVARSEITESPGLRAGFGRMVRRLLPSGMEGIRKITGVHLGFNLVAVVKKPEGV